MSSWMPECLQCGRYLRHPLFMGARLDHAEGFWQHGDLACSNGNPMGIGLISNVDHMGLPAGIKMS